MSNIPENSPLKNEQGSYLETLEQLAQSIKSQYGTVKASDKEAIKLGRTTIQAAIVCGEFAIKAKAHPELGHGKFIKWLEENCVAEGASKDGAVRSIQKWMVLATYSKSHPQEVADCGSLKEAEQVCGQRPLPKTIEAKEQEKLDEGDEPAPKSLPETLLAEMKRNFEQIQFKYDQLTEIDPKLNRFLLSKGYDNDLPILLQEWPSSLGDAYAYFGLPPLKPDTCVRCGHVREDGEWFVPISTYYPLQHLQKYNLWCENCEATCEAELPDVKELENAMIERKFLNVEKPRDRAKLYTLALKNDQRLTSVIDDKKAVRDAFNNEWHLKELNDEESVTKAIDSIQPEIVFCNTIPTKKLWDIYRNFVSSAPKNQLVGTQIYFMVVDKSQPNKPVLGIGAVASDMMSLGDRDVYLGWTTEQRQEKGGRLHNIANGAVIVAISCIGSNFLGAKLMASLVTSQAIQQAWKAKTKKVLVGLTTTSLFGVPSMYDQVKEWSRLGKTKGKVPIEVSPKLYEKWKQFLKETRTVEYNVIMSNSHTQKARIMTSIYNAAGITDYEHGNLKGLYFAEIYQNTKEFLCGKIDEAELKINPLYTETIEQITDRWRKGAINRYRNLKKENRLVTDRKMYGQELSVEDMAE